MTYSTLKVTKTGRRKWRLLDDWITPFATVPRGFITDGASVPRLFWWLLSPAGVLFESAVLHDYLYKYAIKNKAYADNALKQTSLHFNATKIEANTAFIFVKTFGKGKY